jgi:hypothetical protein
VPTTGQVARRRCAECGGVRRWYNIPTQNGAEQTTFVEGLTDGVQVPGSEYAYRCEQGHVSDLYPRCRSRDTTRYRANVGDSHAIVTCHACDRNSALELTPTTPGRKRHHESDPQTVRHT